MKTLLQAIKNIVIIILWAGIGYVLGVFLSSGIQAAMEGTGGMIMAKDYLELKAIPWIFAIVAFFISYKIQVEP